MRNEIQAGGLAGARFVDPVVLARVGNLELVARSVVEGFINGMHRSAHFGASVDFAEHRGYTAGDDIRRVDWKLFGRTDRFYIVEYVPPSAKHMETTLHVLDRLKPSTPGQLAPPMKKLAEHFARRGLLVLISDLYEDPEAVVEAVAPLRFRGHDMIVFHVLDPAEIEFTYDQASAFEDLESGEQIPVVHEALAEQYRALIRENSEALRSKMSELRIDYTLLNTATSLDQALFSYLSMREQMS